MASLSPFPSLAVSPACRGALGGLALEEPSGLSVGDSEAEGRCDCDDRGDERRDKFGGEREAFGGERRGDLLGDWLRFLGVSLWSSVFANLDEGDLDDGGEGERDLLPFALFLAELLIYWSSISFEMSLIS